MAEEAPKEPVAEAAAQVDPSPTPPLTQPEPVQEVAPVPLLGVPPHSGSKPPLYPPEPQGVPAVRPDPTAALIPDMVVDGAAYGSLTVRAASVRGDSHRYQGEPRQDSLAVTRIGRAGDELLLLAVADGVGSAARSHVGSREACRLMATSLDDHAAELAAALREADEARFAELADDAVRGVATLLAHHAQERGDDPAAYATTLRVLLVPLDPAVSVRGFLAVGDGGTALLRDGRWHLAVTEAEHPDDGMIDTRTAALPHSRTARTVLLGPARPGDVLVLCTDGLSTPLAGDGGLREFLALAWSGAAPAPADFLWQAQYRVKSYDDDRTAVVLWEGTP
ncbi:protein phosphatase 2C domain-containing protein [Streptomyces diastatochromogenes]|uniref:protein phosphatase 2C domain-containing protein n=1 Tax=Streptomyces diastatochromogenes TaxID=42236 RepID=UPI00367A5037